MQETGEEQRGRRKGNNKRKVLARSATPGARSLRTSFRVCSLGPTLIRVSRSSSKDVKSNERSKCWSDQGGYIVASSKDESQPETRHFPGEGRTCFSKGCIATIIRIEPELCMVSEHSLRKD